MSGALTVAAVEASCDVVRFDVIESDMTGVEVDIERVDTLAKRLSLMKDISSEALEATLASGRNRAPDDRLARRTSRSE